MITKKHQFNEQTKNTINILKTTYNISQEKIDALTHYHDQVLKWNTELKKLTGDESILIWKKHILSSATLLKHLSSTNSKILDIGSGLGFPGLVIAILTIHKVHLVETNSESCGFLNHIIEQLNLRARVWHCSVQDLDFKNYDYIIARRAPPDIFKLSKKQHHNRLKFLIIRRESIIVPEKMKYISLVNKHSSFNSDILEYHISNFKE